MVTEQVSRLIDAFQSGEPIRAINYHNTPAYRADEYDRELGRIAERFAPTSENDLAAFLETGVWPRDKPGVVIALYNGYRNNYDVFRPLLDKHGLIGWFFVVSGYVECLPEDQQAFAAARNLKTIPDEYADGRTALNWDEVRDLDARHVVASHTRNHTRVSLENQAALEAEIIGSQDDFIANLGHPVRAFAWLFGGAYGETRAADDCVDRAGYEFLFSNLKIQRLRAQR
jgi:peptidoglycan/xylan/chitin deacetylase (PgdA/CDA1 family)